MICPNCKGVDCDMIDSDENYDGDYWQLWRCNTCENKFQLDHDEQRDLEAYLEAPGIVDNPEEAAFYLALNRVSCPKCYSPEFRTEDKPDSTVDGICLDCGHRWSVGVKGTRGPS